jgi:uncharacterized integral membrane protein
MKIIINLFTASIIATWMIVLSLLSIQNITSVSIKFLLFESIQFPIGVLLSFSAATGVFLGAIAPIFWTRPRKAKPYRRSFSESEEELGEFDF